MPLDIPPAIYERVVCSVEAAAKYNIPANVMLAVAFQEGGKPGQAVLNGNGTYDYGAMQINTAWLHELGKYNITAHDVSTSGCYPYELAGWRIRRHIVRDPGNDLWQKVANYHSYTPVYNLEYRRQIMIRAAYWADWLAKRYVTVEAVSPSPRPSSTPQSVAHRDQGAADYHYVARSISARD